MAPRDASRHATMRTSHPTDYTYWHRSIESTQVALYMVQICAVSALIPVLLQSVCTTPTVYAYNSKIRRLISYTIVKFHTCPAVSKYRCRKGSLHYSSRCFAAKYPREEVTLLWCRRGEPGLEVDKPSALSGVVGAFSVMPCCRDSSESIVAFSKSWIRIGGDLRVRSREL